jgi:metal-sulfur cluster biosynthetic enzyme
MNVETNNNIQSTIALNSLLHVIDPEIGLNVVDLGLIYKIFFNEDSKVIDVVMTLTTQFCPMGESIMDGVKSALENAFKDWEVKVELVFEPHWNHEMISEEGKDFLNQ